MSGFIDTVAKASEVAKSDSNQPAHRFDVDKRIDIEKDKKDDNKDKRFDPDKRIDVKEPFEKNIDRYKSENTTYDADENRATGKEQINVDNRIPHDYQQKADKPSEVVSLNFLTNSQKSELIQKGFSEGMLDKTTYEDGVYRINTSNSRYAEGKHPDTNIPYKTKNIEVLGNKFEGVFAVFDSKFDAKLPESKIIAKDKVQFEECNKQLKDEIQQNPELRKQFSKRQIEQIEQGKTPSGYVWNHNEIRGKMELVDFKTHELTPHTGGKAIWGGGSKAR